MEWGFRAHLMNILCLHSELTILTNHVLSAQVATWD